MLSASVEDYAKAIYVARGRARRRVDERARERLGVSAPAVSAMVKKLDGARLRRARSRYRGVRLTDEGRRVALEVVRHHRLLETYLARRARGAARTESTPRRRRSSTCSRRARGADRGEARRADARPARRSDPPDGTVVERRRVERSRARTVSPRLDSDPCCSASSRTQISPGRLELVSEIRHRPLHGEARLSRHSPRHARRGRP